jgi:serine/threonine protein kinase
MGADSADASVNVSDPKSIRVTELPLSFEFQSILEDFTKCWLRGECQDVESYLPRILPANSDLVVELVYREFCLSEIDQRYPDPAQYLTRFPEHRPRLEALLAVHAVSPGDAHEFESGLLFRGSVGQQDGEEIGQYHLRRELGRGSSARVFLAEEMDLENRLVVVKLTTRPTREPWLLARVSHAHIVEILSYAMVDDGDSQLICMPFLGGATLSAVLAHRRGDTGHRGGRGGLLRDLDAVAAPEFVGGNPASPARELLGRLSESHAMAWITARLAEALDHAFAQRVIHGDLKPSNILVAADGTPMLLDFNLAQDWSLHGSQCPPEDLGGTLAYMAPERLRDIASAGCGHPEGPPQPGLGGGAGCLDDVAHRGDIYALGMVLLEAITGASPPPTRHETRAQSNPRYTLRQRAAELAEFRERGAAAVIRAAEQDGRRSIPPALRAVLRRCLATQSAERYSRALELAEDLNRWRADRPLAYASEPFLISSVGRLLRRRSKLIVAAAIALVVSLATTAFLVSHSQATLAMLALHKLARNLDDLELPAFQLHRPGNSQLQDPEDPQVLATAIRALKDYDVLGNREWRQIPEVRNLPQQDREDLELFLMEQAFRFCKPLADRPRSLHDRQWGVMLVDSLDTDPPLQALAELRLRFARELGRSADGRLLGESPRTIAARPGGANRPRAPSPVSPCLDEYLLGVAAELEDHIDPAPMALLRVEPPAAAGSAVRPELNEEPLPASAFPGAGKALRHYQAVLTRNPASFWASYRAAVVCFTLRRWSEAASHLEHCARHRPENAILHGQLAACFSKLGLLDQAARECDRALELAPNLGEFYRSRAFIRARKGQTEGLEQDLDRFELLGRSLARTYFHSPPTQELGDLRPADVASSQRILDLDSSPIFVARPDDPIIEPDRLDRQELDTRAFLAMTISQAGADSQREGAASRQDSKASKQKAVALAIRELDKVLAVEPGHLPARLIRMVQSLEDGRLSEARQDLELGMLAPELSDLLRKDPASIRYLTLSTYHLARRGLSDSALDFGRRLVAICAELKVPRGQAYYYLARARGMAARTDPEQISEAAENLHYARIAHPRFVEWYHGDHEFDPVRTKINAALDRLSDYATSY